MTLTQPLVDTGRQRGPHAGQFPSLGAGRESAGRGSNSQECFGGGVSPFSFLRPTTPGMSPRGGTWVFGRCFFLVPSLGVSVPVSFPVTSFGVRGCVCKHRMDSARGVGQERSRRGGFRGGQGHRRAPHLGSEKKWPRASPLAVTSTRSLSQEGTLSLVPASGQAAGGLRTSLPPLTRLKASARSWGGGEFRREPSGSF